MYSVEDLEQSLADSILALNHDEISFRTFRLPSRHVFRHKKNPKKDIRKIFGAKIELLPFEESALSELYSLIKDKDSFFPPNWAFADTLRFFSSTEFDPEKTIKALQEHFEHRASSYPVQITDKALEILNMGFCYIHGRDKVGRPMLIAKPQLLYECRKMFSQEELNYSMNVFYEYVTRNCFIEGQIETWNFIVDMEDFSVMNINAMMKQMASFVAAHYRCRLEKGYMVNGGFFFNAIWAVIKKIADEQVQVKMTSDKDFSQLKAIAHHSQLEERYGGSAPNREPHSGRYFPPEDLGRLWEGTIEEDAKIMSKAEYLEFLGENEEFVVSPHLSEEEKTQVLTKRGIIPQQEVIIKKDTISSVASETQISSFRCLTSSSALGKERKPKKLKTHKQVRPLIGLNKPLPSLYN